MTALMNNSHSASDGAAQLFLLQLQAHGMWFRTLCTVGRAVLGSREQAVSCVLREGRNTWLHHMYRDADV